MTRVASKVLFLNIEEDDEYEGDNISAYQWLKRPVLPPYPDLSNAPNAVNFIFDSPPPFICSWDSIRDEVSAFLETDVPRKDPAYENIDSLADKYGEHLPCRHAMSSYLAMIYHFVPRDKLPGTNFPTEKFTSRIGITGSPDFDFGLVEGSRCLTIGEIEHPRVLGPVSVSEIAAAFQSPATGNITHGCVLPVFGRLHEHITLSNARYGFVTTGEYTWFCTILPGGAMAISEPVENATWAYLFYMLYAGLQVDCPLQHSVGASWVIKPWPETWRKAREMEVKEQVKTLVRNGISGMKSDSLENELQYWNLKTDFVLGPREEEWVMSCTIMHATYKGKEVVLKIRDLSAVDGSFEGDLVPFLQEVLAYKHMKKLQGVCVPELLGFGFASGFMLAVIVLSYAGKRIRRHPGTPGAAAAVMKKVHGAGISCGRLGGDILVSSLNPLKVMAVSFSEARLANDVRKDAGEPCMDAEVHSLAERVSDV